MENIIDTLFGNMIFSNIYFVDSNPGEVETIEIKKINSEVKEITKKQTFNLVESEIGNDGLPSLKIRELIKNRLIVLMNFNSKNTEFKYFNVGFLKGLFYKKNPKRLLDQVNQFKEKADWIITSEDIIKELSSLEEFESLSGYGDIRLVGKIGETMVFKMMDIENTIYLGKKESITAVFNRNLQQGKSGVMIEYLLTANDKVEKIMVF
jgi:hypothetical protein